MQRLIWATLIFATLMSGCAVNPVTGKRELSLVSAEQEVAIGRDNYQPSQQMQGGRYVVDPDLNVYVNNVGQRLAQVSDRPGLPYEFVVLNNDVPNAWALPGGKIAINRGLLLYLEDEAQLAAVLGHEIVHAAARHGASQMTRTSILGAGSQLIGLLAQTQDVPGAGFISDGANITAAAFNARYGRNDELESDEYGMLYMEKLGYDPQAAVELQETFVQLSEGRSRDALSNLFASHPPSEDRVNANQARARTMSGNLRNRQAFQRATAQIRRDAKAYELHSEGLAMAQGGDLTGGLRLVEQALNQQPNENLFWDSKGRILSNQKRYAEAEDAFSRAIRINPELFSGYLGRGIARLEQKQLDAARGDLNQAQALLQTGAGVFMLGRLEAESGNLDEARAYFQSIANNNDVWGKRAQEALKVLSN